MYALLALWTGLLVLGFAFGRLDEKRINRIPRANKLLSSAILVACALLWWRVGAAGTPLASYAALLFWGMAFSLLGDLIMAELLPLPQHVLFGMAAFGAAHVLYIVGYLRLGTVLGLHSGSARAAALVGFLLVAVVLWWTLIRSPQTPAMLSYGSLAYALLLAAMAGLALSLALQEVHFVPLAMGGALFVISDTLLGHRLFQNGHFLLIGDLVWMTYIVGQLLIVFSTAAGLRML
ncbi:MAG: lysoplasmalogenase family protein [Anaerolineae bacterium]|nr:lysoplasmalogenase family protein [Anaerolineae bacterium]